MVGIAPELDASNQFESGLEGCWGPGRRGSMTRIGRTMDPAQRVVTSGPLTELWNEQGPLTATRVGDADGARVVALLQSGATFVVADVRLHWLPAQERFAFWKSEVKSRLAPPGAHLHSEDFPGGYCYLASEWRLADGAAVVLLEKMH